MSTQKPVTIIAEAAQGFEGNVTLARLLVKAAKQGNADVVKFQLVLADELATRDYAYYGLFKQLEMPMTDWQAVACDAAAAGLGLAFDVFGPESLRCAIELGACAVKLHSTDFFNAPLVAAVQNAAPRFLFSVGGIEADEIAAYIERAHPSVRAKMTLMYGFQAEPTLAGDNNLARLASLRTRFPSLDTGFMDHADGDQDEAGWLGMLALPFGVSVIEKHITLERSLQMEDYVSALSAAEFALYVRRVRLAETLLGSASLELSEPERAYRTRAVKVAVALRDLAPGTVIGGDDAVLLRAPKERQQTVFQGLEPIVGRTVARAIAAGQPINAEDLQ